MSSETWTERRRSLVVAGALGAAGLLFVAAVLWYYNWRPTVGTVILSLGWVALLGAGVLLARAATAFDQRAEHLPAEAISDERRLELEREKRSLLKAIKEIEFDQGMGKIDDAGAAAAVARYRARAVEILRLLDEESGARGDQDARTAAQIEKELARRLAKAQILPAPTAAATRDDEAPFCTKCGTRNDPDAAFCKKCGNGLAAGAPS